jgi:hypothetical protein
VTWSWALDPTLDAGGYDADISRRFWEAFSQRKTAVNAHPDSIVALAKAATTARGKRFIACADEAAAAATARYAGGSSAGGAGAGAAASSTSGAGAAAGDHGGSSSSSSSSAFSSSLGLYGAGTGVGSTSSTRGWALSASSSSAAGAGGGQSAQHAAEAQLKDENRFERWLIRRRMHYVETHSADAPEYPPVVAEAFNASLVPFANLQAHLLHEADPERYADVGPEDAGYTHYEPGADRGLNWAAGAAGAGAAGAGGASSSSGKRREYVSEDEDEDEEEDANASHYAGLEFETLFPGSKRPSGPGSAGAGLTLPISDTAAANAAVASFLLSGRMITPHALAYALLKSEPRLLVDGTAAAAVAAGERLACVPAPALLAGGSAGGAAGSPASAAASAPLSSSAGSSVGTRAGGGSAGAAVFDPLRLGALIDAKDEGGSWWLAQVVDIEPPWAASAFRGTPMDPALRKQAAAAASGAAEAGAGASAAAELGDEGADALSPAAAAPAGAPASKRKRGGSAALASSAGASGYASDTTTATGTAYGGGQTETEDSGAGAGGKAAWDGVVRICVHYHGWPEEHDEWLEVPPRPVLEALCASASAAATPAVSSSASLGAGGSARSVLASASLRAAVAASRVAPALTHASPLSTICMVCRNRKAGQLVFCDAPSCGKAYHLGCLRPALEGVPTGKWYCPEHAAGGRRSVGGHASKR